jgi:hypothetical protein
MPDPTPESLRHFGWSDFDRDRIRKQWQQCPVSGCSATLKHVPYGAKRRDRTLPWCPGHGIRLHSNTFSYWSEHDGGDAARRRNFIVRDDLVRKIVLRKGMKAESHRLGQEMSEDALSWNVFVSLAEADRLREAVKFLTGRELRRAPSLYLWGRRIDGADRRHDLYEPLARVRANLEPNIHAFPTEPDIMLVAEGELLVCIEAKFGSANPMSRDAEIKPGEKPSSRAGLLERYLGNHTSERTRSAICREKIPEPFCTQLFRNVVFASEMADAMSWHVVNLAKGGSSCKDPTDEVCGYLHPHWRQSFTFRTWEGLHDAVIAGDPDLARLDRYLRGKSAHFERAFTLSQ